MKELELIISKGGVAPKNATERILLGSIPAEVGKHQTPSGEISINQIDERNDIYSLTGPLLRPDTGRTKRKTTRRIQIGWTQEYGCIDLNKRSRLEARVVWTRN